MDFENFTEFLICISPWNSFHKRVETLKDFFGRGHLIINNRIYRVVHEGKVVVDKKAKRVYIILDLAGSVYFILLPFIYRKKPAAVCFPAVRVDPGKINHYEFKFEIVELFNHFWVNMQIELFSQYLNEFMRRWNIKLGENLWVARRAKLDPKKPNSAIDIQLETFLQEKMID